MLTLSNSRLRLALTIGFALLCPVATRLAPAQQSTADQQPAQQQQEPSETPPSATIPYVLHVYTNRIQIPALIINRDSNLLPPVLREQITMRLDGGPPFHPTRIRLQSDDPITLNIFLDAGGSEEFLLRNFDSTLATLVPASINPRDRVDIFAADCALVHISNLRVDAESLRLGVHRALTAPSLHARTPDSPHCTFHDHIWDAMAIATHDIASRSGRKVILAVTAGEDRGSSNKWTDLESYANSFSIAFFAVRSIRLPIFRAPILRNQREDELQALCNSTGGVVLETYASDLLKTLKHFTDLFRNRYIIEFPRPRNGTAGRHDISIKVPDPDAIILVSGTTAQLPSDEEKNDPNKVPSDESGLPAEGTRRPTRRR